MTKEVWYALEYNRTFTNDWYDSSISTDSEESIMARLNTMQRDSTFNYRAVRKTLTTEVLGEKK